MTYISSTLAKKKSCSRTTGQFDQEFSITAKPGQQISFTLIDIEASVPRDDEDHYGQEDLGYILDTASDEVFPIQQKGAVEAELAEVSAHTASVVLSSNPASNFLIAFKGTCT